MPIEKQTVITKYCIYTFDVEKVKALDFACKYDS